MSPRVLQLSLKRKPFAIMVSGEKTTEYRAIKPWMNSRLFDSKSGARRDYDCVTFTNGYGATRPWFTAQFLHVTEEAVHTAPFSNGVSIHSDTPLYCIHLGSITDSGNINK